MFTGTTHKGEDPALLAWYSTQGRFTWGYLLLGLTVLISGPLREIWPWLHYLTKPLIGISLIGFFALQARTRDSVLRWGILMALIFSLFGDILLMFAGNLFFLLGLGAFLLAHLCYILVFSTRLGQMTEPAILRRKPWLIIFFILYGLTLMGIVWQGMGDMFLPVCMYALIVLLMALTALNRWKRVPVDSFGWVFMGALLFMLSDSLIAINRFAFEIPFSSIWIMLTYMAAQYLIVMGMLRQVRAPHPQIPELN